MTPDLISALLLIPPCGVILSLLTLWWSTETDRP